MTDYPEELGEGGGRGGRGCGKKKPLLSNTMHGSVDFSQLSKGKRSRLVFSDAIES